MNARRMERELLAIVSALLMSSPRFKGDYREAVKEAVSLVNHCSDVAEQINNEIEDQEREALQKVTVQSGDNDDTTESSTT